MQLFSTDKPAAVGTILMAAPLSSIVRKRAIKTLLSSGVKCVCGADILLYAQRFKFSIRPMSTHLAYLSYTRESNFVHQDLFSIAPDGGDTAL
jgi:hypothetical protein